MKLIFFCASLVLCITAKSTFWDNIIPSTYEEKLESFKKQQDAKKLQAHEKIDDTIESLKNLLGKFHEKVTPESKGLITDIGTKISAKKQEKLNEQLQSFDQIVTFIDKIATESKKKSEERQKQFDELKNQVAPYIKQAIEKISQEKEAKKQEKQENFKAHWDQIKSTLSDFKIKLDAKKAEREAEEEVLLQSLKEKLSETVNNAVNALKEKIAEEKSDNANLVVTSTIASVIVAEEKATFLDDITGSGAWQNVTWILLIVCILLAIALILTIIYQLKQRNNYEQLGGQDVPQTRSAGYPTKEIQQF